MSDLTVVAWCSHILDGKARTLRTKNPSNGDMALVLKTDALEEIERLRMALTRFGKHDSLCNVVGDYTSTCSCGLDKEADR